MSIFVDSNGLNRIIVVRGANDRLTPADVDEALPVLTRADCIILQLEIPIETVYQTITVPGAPPPRSTTRRRGMIMPRDRGAFTRRGFVTTGALGVFGAIAPTARADPAEPTAEEDLPDSRTIRPCR